MSEDDEGSFGDGVGAGVTFFIAGIVVPLIFLGMSAGEDFVSFLVIFGGFAACVVFGEYYLTLTSGVAFGAGLVMASLASFDWWFAGLGVTATLINIWRYAISNNNGVGAEDQGNGLGSPDLSPLA
jgi:hypothetical protein